MPITKASSSAVAPGAKGELVVGTTTNDSGILGVGANDTVLTADSSTATGLKWASVASGAYTLLSTTTLSGTSTTISSINQTYKHLLVVINAATGASNMFVRIQANGSTTLSSAGGWDSWSASNFSSGNGRTAVSTTTVCSGFLLLHNYANTSYMKSGITCFNGDLTGQFATGGYFYRSTSAVTSITIDNSVTQSFTSGQVLIYGVN